MSTSFPFERVREANGTSKLQFCRELLEQLNPGHPPENSRPKEFLWQYRALCERVEVYEQQLKGMKESVDPSSRALQRAELALDFSLHYFEAALAPDTDADEEDEL